MGCAFSGFVNILKEVSTTLWKKLQLQKKVQAKNRHMCVRCTVYSSRQHYFVLTSDTFANSKFYMYDFRFEITIHRLMNDTAFNGWVFSIESSSFFNFMRTTLNCFLSDDEKSNKKENKHWNQIEDTSETECESIKKVEEKVICESIKNHG